MDQSIGMLFAPWGLILGGGLIALSFLSLFGVQFFKTRLLTIGAFVAGLVIIGSMELIWFAGNGFYSFQAQKTAASECYFDGEASLSQSAGIKNNNITPAMASFVTGCMNKDGYEWMPGHHKCAEFPYATNAYCYRPTGFFSRVFTDLQLVWE